MVFVIFFAVIIVALAFVAGGKIESGAKEFMRGLGFGILGVALLFGMITIFFGVTSGNWDSTIGGMVLYFLLFGLPVAALFSIGRLVWKWVA